MERLGHCEYSLEAEDTAEGDYLQGMF